MSPSDPADPPAFHLDAKATRDLLDGLSYPRQLDAHPLASAAFVQAYLRNPAEHRELSPGEALAHALASQWRERFMPEQLAPEFKRRWLLFLVLEVGHFYPFRKRLRPPASLTQIGRLLADDQHLALVIADGDGARAAELLKDGHAACWQAVAPGDSDFAPGPSTVDSRRKRALEALAEELNGLVAPPGTWLPVPSAPSPTRVAEESANAIRVATPSVLDLYLAHGLPPSRASSRPSGCRRWRWRRASRA